MADILLIGKRAKVLESLASILEKEGHAVSRTNNLADLENIDVSHVDVVAFGRALSDQKISELENKYRIKNDHLQFVRGLAPIPLLLAAQINAAATVSKKSTILGDKPALSRETRVLTLPLAKSAHVVIEAWWLTILYSGRSRTLVDSTIEAGAHQIELEKTIPLHKAHIVVKLDDAETYVL